ncbi:hypothetical protein EV360DRAFT_36197 [Lentinula raphanica]|nr:hypothetical protein EV360DRAFT_36197 [Lentinula raphanica]
MELVSPTHDSKPPLPTTPKPDFSTLYSAGRSSRRRAHKISSPHSHSNSRANSYEDEFDMRPPPTQNTLDPLSRAGLVRKSRKLAQVFGQTPNGASIRPTASGIAESSGLRSSFLEITSPTTSRHHSSNSMAVFSKDHSSDTKERVKENVDRVKGKGIWPPPASTRYISAVSGRRHSTPLTPDEFEFLNELHRQEPVSDADRTSSFFSSGENENLIEIGEAQEVERDRASFIDWDEESPGMHENGPEDTRRHTHPVELLTQSPSGSQNSSRTSISSLAFAPPSAYPEERAEAEKRRKREKLAKLHRFLGSRVPAGLVLGQSDEDSESGLPGLSMAEETDAEGSSEEKRSWKKGMTKVTRRRSGSESGVSSDWSDIRDRRKDDMGEGEKSRMVKRAIRLEKVFGVAPPQTLYAYGHVPHAHSSPGVIASTTIAPTMIRSSSTSVAHAHPQLPSSSSTSKRALTRPISRELLLPKDNDADQIETAIDVEIEAGDASMALPMTRPRGASITFTHYEHSLNSLGDILDRDDRASLQELHDILYQAGGMEEGFLPESDQVLDVSLGSGSVRSERRRSLPALPARTSIASFNSIDSVASIITKVSLDDADVEGSDGAFQVRRRRAAKLTQFFGVNYRDLVEDVLDSIEKGVELENGKGLSTQEAEVSSFVGWFFLCSQVFQDLLMKLRTLKGKRTGLLS